ncbi:LacI family DNA-binding transcriptional regulator [Curtobacterium pusillum]|uniref:LacI family DNA-binding transcriptional regulator n=1 Tax=Curtobacterium pusillum TaxID=69373 RepID=A0ABX2M5P7_9MICO|nr:LacI family DNA-binding transcriptional regulator [Curtobacterium pusillum]NUU13201.1 LacI family DNA-binding transcriptional regulator [Curtobacterium pusillum]GLK31797.1 LacI family transcriptional regulator [Curtobacterium pusillum]
MPKSVTLKDVAAKVGVTSAAASMALAGHERISERTRAAVKQAAAELGYVPSSAGRALRSQRADAVALIVPNSSTHVFGHLYFMHVLTGMSTAANAHDAQVIVSTNADTSSGGVAYERVMRSRTADGAIVTSAAIDDDHVQGLVASGLPVVLIGNYPHLADAVSVGIDDVTATVRLVDHLVTEHARRRLLHVTGTLDHQTGIDRRDGFLRAAAAHGIDDASVIEGDLSEDSGAAAIEQLLRERTDDRPDAIVFANDDMAVGGLRVLRRAGIRVPEDVSVVGFDDFGLARVTTPGITTVRVPAEEMGRIATERLFELVDGRRTGDGHTELPVDVVLRGSCGCDDDPSHPAP